MGPADSAARFEDLAAAGGRDELGEGGKDRAVRGLALQLRSERVGVDGVVRRSLLLQVRRLRHTLGPRRSAAPPYEVTGVRCAGRLPGRAFVEVVPGAVGAAVSSCRRQTPSSECSRPRTAMMLPLSVRVAQRSRCNRKASSSCIISPSGTEPRRRRTRSTSTERTCSACAFEVAGRPVRLAGRSTWNG